MMAFILLSYILIFFKLSQLKTLIGFRLIFLIFGTHAELQIPKDIIKFKFNSVTISYLQRVVIIM
jgi:hypothetical protein